MAAKIGSDVKVKNKFFDREGNEVKPVMKEGKMYWYSETTGAYLKDWFRKEQTKLGGKR